MYNALAVRRLQRIGHLNPEVKQSLQFQRLALHQMLQRLPGQTLHHDEQPPIVLPNFVNRTNVGMVERRSSPRLAPKPFQSLGILGSFFRKKLQRDESPQRSVFRFVDNPHPTAAQHFQNAVVGNCCANHSWGSVQVPFGGNPGAMILGRIDHAVNRKYVAPKFPNPTRAPSPRPSRTLGVLRG